MRFFVLCLVSVIGFLSQSCNLLSGNPSADSTLFVPPIPPLPNIHILGAPDVYTDVNGSLIQSYPYTGSIHAGKFFISDTYHSRVLIWNSVPTSAVQPADLILGQVNSSFNDVNHGGISASTMYYPYGVCYDGTRLYVTDEYNHRLLGWNSFPTQNGQAADFVIGQPDFTSNTYNNGGISGHSFRYPGNMYCTESQLFLADSRNNRVLAWNTPPTSNVDADFVLGQADFTTGGQNTGGISGDTFYDPNSVDSDGTKLFVADAANHRILVWNSIPTAHVAADFAIGQTSLTTNFNGHGADQLYYPWGTYSNGTEVYVADGNNNRVLKYPMPSDNGASATLALGQPDLTSNTGNNGGISNGTLYSPYGIFGDGTHLFVTDAYNSRTLGWNSLPTATGQAADLALGETVIASPTTMGYPSAAFSDHTRFFVSDCLNNRVLIWNSIPTMDNQPADLVVGQPDLTSGDINNGGVSLSTMYCPSGLYSDGTRLFVADFYNNRTLVWNEMPTSNGQAASFVLGQPDESSTDPNSGDISGSSMYEPNAAYSDGTRLYVVDSNNNRVLVWNSIPSSSVAASFALGQANLSGNSSGASSTTMNWPSAVYSDGNQLYVSDLENSRVLVWNSIPTSNIAASFELGQPDLNTGSANTGGISASTMYNPGGIYGDGKNFFVADYFNNRVLGWSSYPHSNRAADMVFGQPDFTSSSAGLSGTTLNTPWSVYSDQRRIFIGDYSNNRVLILPIP